MTGSDELIVDLLTTRGILTEEQAAEAREQADETNDAVIEVLDKLGYVSEEQVMMILAGEYGMDTFDLTDYTIPGDVIESVPGDLARQYKVIPVMKNDGTVIVAMENPTDLETLDSLRYILKTDVEGVIVPRNQIRQALEQHYGGVEESVENFLEDITEGAVDISEVTGTTQLYEEVPEDTEEDAPIIRLVSLIILEAFRKRASDIHMEPLEKRFRIRYRIDGVLNEVDNPPKYLQNNILSRLKIMSRMDISEHRVPQDGRIQITAMGRELDLRVSDIPCTHGESIVMRILDKTSMMLGIPELGFLADDAETIEHIIGLPDGLFLVTGPTGSGKTTSLYAFLHQLNQPTRKIITVEDPVEYEIPGINQVNINTAVNLTFAAALRSMLRQAPNIIMVGEIRDMETGNIAINAALTGHLVFSTLHTNDAPSAVARLVDMGVKPFLVASAVRAIMAQRLVRKVCKNCAEPIDVTDGELAALGLPRSHFDGSTLMRGTGCNECNGGYRGRIGIFEIFMVDERVQELIYEHASSSQIREYAREAGMRTLREDGLRKAANGMTTLEEVIRVTATDEADVAVEA
ncbi:MAG: Flp pilus assembly complex ATPase component TadA [Candidatus Pacebacteria bacterium]|nr:Flp pilus assembly complex ATPase component TadA [Candidatus Paceibacterota bacterium]